MARWMIQAPGGPPLANRILSMGLRRRMREKRTWRDWACYAAKEACIPPMVHPTIVYTRHSSREPDYDGLVTSGKPIIDGLVLAGVLPDDAPKHLQVIYRWRFAPNARARTVVCIDGVEAEGAA